MIDKRYKRSKIYDDFDDSKRFEFFELKQKKFLHHVDTLYYSVFLKYDSEKENSPGDYKKLINLFEVLKNIVDETGVVTWFDETDGVVFTRKRFSIYSYCISLPNYYDIFFAKSVPNSSTPRICVQLRSVGLWGLGEYELVKQSYYYLKNLLSLFDVEIERTQENRIDYCYHSNYFQSMKDVFNDEFLTNNLRTSFQIYSKVGRKDGKKLSVEYLSLGNRKSNNLFFRSYNKVREVIEENYKSFFFDIWFSYGLISKYDYLVYSYAFKCKRYDSIYKGMMQFYIDYGLDQGLKDKFSAVLKSTSCTIDDIKKLIKGVLPLPTLVVNFEFQTMRKFYYYSDDVINTLPILRNCEEYQLLRLFQILDNRKVFLDYLTRYTVSFVQDVDVKDSKFLDFWLRLHNCKLDLQCNVKFNRVYSKNRDFKLIVDKIKSNMATLNVYLNNFGSDYDTDLSNLISVLNDNDMIPDNDGVCHSSGVDVDKYMFVKEKRKMALKSIVKMQSKSIS